MSPLVSSTNTIDSLNNEKLNNISEKLLIDEKELNLIYKLEMPKETPITKKINITTSNEESSKISIALAESSNIDSTLYSEITKFTTLPLLPSINSILSNHSEQHMVNQFPNLALNSTILKKNVSPSSTTMTNSINDTLNTFELNTTFLSTNLEVESSLPQKSPADLLANEAVLEENRIQNLKKNINQEGISDSDILTAIINMANATNSKIQTNSINDDVSVNLSKLNSLTINPNNTNSNLIQTQNEILNIQSSKLIICYNFY